MTLIQNQLADLKRTLNELRGGLYWEGDLIFKDQPEGFVISEGLFVDGSLDCSFCNLIELPKRLSVIGNMYCHDSEFTCLPEYLMVGGTLFCSHNKLTELPEKLWVGGDLHCCDNRCNLRILDSMTVLGRVIQ